MIVKKIFVDFQRLSFPHDLGSLVTGQELNDDWGRSVFPLGKIMDGTDLYYGDVYVELVVGECDEVLFHCV